MKKLMLNLDELAVESFETGDARAGGTVRANQEGYTGLCDPNEGTLDSGDVCCGNMFLAPSRDDKVTCAGSYACQNTCSCANTCQSCALCPKVTEDKTWEYLSCQYTVCATCASICACSQAC